MIEELVSKVGKPKTGTSRRRRRTLLIRSREGCGEDRIVKGKPGKADRSDAVDKIKEDLLNEMAPAIPIRTRLMRLTLRRRR